MRELFELYKLIYNDVLIQCLIEILIRETVQQTNPKPRTLNLPRRPSKDSEFLDALFNLHCRKRFDLNNDY